MKGVIDYVEGYVEKDKNSFEFRNIIKSYSKKTGFTTLKKSECFKPIKVKILVKRIGD